MAEERDPDLERQVAEKVVDEVADAADIDKKTCKAAMRAWRTKAMIEEIWVQMHWLIDLVKYLSSPRQQGLLFVGLLFASIQHWTRFHIYFTASWYYMWWEGAVLPGRKPPASYYRMKYISLGATAWLPNPLSTEQEVETVRRNAFSEIEESRCGCLMMSMPILNVLYLALSSNLDQSELFKRCEYIVNAYSLIFEDIVGAVIDAYCISEGGSPIFFVSMVFSVFHLAKMMYVNRLAVSEPPFRNPQGALWQPRVVEPAL